MCYTLINLEVVNLKEIEVSTVDRFFYKGSEIYFEYESHDMDLSAFIMGNLIAAKNRTVFAGVADAGNDIVT